MRNIEDFMTESAEGGNWSEEVTKELKPLHTPEGLFAGTDAETVADGVTAAERRKHGKGMSEHDVTAAAIRSINFYKNRGGSEIKNKVTLEQAVNILQTRLERLK